VPDLLGRAAARFTGAFRDRVLAVLILAPSAVALAVAAWLDPDPGGFGTHQQLGLGGCTLHQLTGILCPTCGMTTTFALAVHGHPWAGFLNQPFGFVLFLITCGAAVLGIADLVRPRGRVVAAWRWIEAREGWIAGALFLGLLLGWAWKLSNIAGPS
jgi:hypothetical protein